MREKHRIKASFWEKFISFGIPLVGLVLWGAYKVDYPKKSEECLTVAIIGLIIAIILYSIVYCSTGYYLF